jgi:magnesium transporter
MTPPPSGLANAAGAQGQEMVAAPTICQISPTRCQARTRLYRGGKLELEGFPVADISEYLADESVTIWLDLRAPGRDDLAVLSEEFGLHPLAVEAALRHSQRSKLDRYRRHLFLAKFGVGYLLYGLLDYVVDGQLEAVQSLDDCMEELEDRLFDDAPRGVDVQRRSFQLRKSLVMLRRIINPMSEIVSELIRRDLRIAGDELMPYYQAVNDQILRAAEWTDGLRDLTTSILETNLTIQGNRMNIITKKVTGWAAIIAVPTFIASFFGMNVPYPGFGEKAGLAASIATIASAGLLPYLIFKRKDWL